jgi:hypothetical protein
LPSKKKQEKPAPPLAALQSALCNAMRFFFVAGGDLSGTPA